MPQDEGALTADERRQFREFLSNQTEIFDKVERLERVVEEKNREAEALRTERKEYEILEKMQAEEKWAKNFLRKFTEKYYYCETWEPKFDEVKNDALRHLEEFMQTLHAPEEGIQQKKNTLKRHLDNYRERIKRRQKEIKKSVLQSLELRCAGDFWVLRVEERHGKARAEIMTPELFKDKDVTDLLSRLLIKCKNRRWGIISGVSLLSGVVVGIAVGIGLATKGLVTVGCATGIGFGVGAGVFILVGVGILIYAHWPKIKEFSSECVDKIKKKFASVDECSTFGELIESLQETVQAEHPMADNVVFIH